MITPMYEGELKKYADKVYIRVIPDTTIKKYIRGQALDVQLNESTALELIVDQAYYWNVAMDDVLKKQADIAWLDKWSTDASEQMKIVIDTEVLAVIKAGVTARNKNATAGRISQAFNLGASGAPVQLTKTNVLDYIIDCGTVLDEQNVPETGRWIVIPAWVAGIVKKSDIKDASLTGDSTSVMRNGRIGMIDRFTAYSSNLLPYTVADLAYDILFGHKEGMTYASQIVETEKIRSERSFDDLVRGLCVYGRKVVKDTSIGALYAKK